MKTLIIAEKPSVARDIARVLKVKQKGDGFFHSEAYIISWAIGHLVTLKEPDEYHESYKKWRMQDLPIIPPVMELKALPKTAPQLKQLVKMLNSKEVSQVICATDSGREGELIFRYIYQYAQCQKPVKRLWISSLTDSAIETGLKKMKDGQEYDNLFASAKCRAEADWLVGMNATRAYSIRYGSFGNHFPMGRVQTPTLAIIVNRHHEITAFVPENYYTITAHFKTQAGDIYKGAYLNPLQTEPALQERVATEDAAKAIAAKVKGQPATVITLETEEKRQLAPQLFDLTELQRECNRKLGFSAQKTLTIAQALYEQHKMITYPRTDSRYLSQDMVPKLRPTLQSLPAPYDALTAPLLAQDKLPTSTRMVNDAKVTDHHAIIPTGSKKPLGVLSPDEKAVYDRILRNFIAAFYGPYVYDVTTAITQVLEEKFRSRGKIDKNQGWKAVYAHEKEKPTKDDVETLPPITQGEAVDTKKVDVANKKTQPPKPYTEATLLSAMEHAGRFVEDEALKEALKSSGLGTPATRAAMIEKLITSGYITRSKKNLLPTEKGIRLISLVPPEMRQPETTGKWERGLSRIAAGELGEEKFMDSIRRYVAYLVGETRR